MEIYRISYTDEALQDLRDIFEYISLELKVPEIAAAQVRRILNHARSLDTFPERCKPVNWEPWSDIGMRQMPVDNFMIFYIIEAKFQSVQIVRVLYSKRNIQEIAEIDK